MLFSAGKPLKVSKNLYKIKYNIYLSELMWIKSLSDHRVERYLHRMNMSMSMFMKIE